MRRLSGKTILVTGASGFIGSHLVRRLEEMNDVKLVLLSRDVLKDTKASQVTASLHELTRESWIKCGVTQIDIVLHLGAFTPKQHSDINALTAIYDANITGTHALLESLPNVPEKIVFASTLDVYDFEGGAMPLTEHSPVKPAGLYGASKYYGEHHVRAYAKQQGCGYAILRYGHIYGPGEAAYRKLIPEAIRALLAGKSPVLYGDGSVKRDFLYVGDAVEATLRAAAADNGIEPVNIVAGESKPIRDYVAILARLTGFAGTLDYQPDKPSGQSLQFSNKRMFEVLGAWPLFSLEEGLRWEISYFKALLHA